MLFDLLFFSHLDKKTEKVQLVEIQKEFLKSAKYQNLKSFDFFFS